MTATIAAAASCLPLAHALDGVPGLALAVPLLVAASLVFAATRHEDPAAIRRVALGWLGWLTGVLGVVLALVMLLAWLA